MEQKNKLKSKVKTCEGNSNKTSEASKEKDIPKTIDTDYQRLYAEAMEDMRNMVYFGSVAICDNCIHKCDVIEAVGNMTGGTCTYFIYKNDFDKIASAGLSS